MAVSVTLMRAGRGHRSFDIVATADGDTTTGAFTHGLSTRTGGLAIQNPDTEIVTWYEPLLSAPARLSGWATTVRGATEVTATKTTEVGSGNAGAQVRLHLKRIAMNGG